MHKVAMIEGRVIRCSRCEGVFHGYRDDVPKYLFRPKIDAQYAPYVYEHRRQDGLWETYCPRCARQLQPA